MNWKLFLGTTFHRTQHAALSSRLFPLTRYFPRGRSWLYDAQRFAGTKDFRVIFDVGANDGETAYGLVRYFPKTRIYCFEPVASTMELLKRNYGHYPNVQCVPLALGSRPDEVSIPLHVNSGMNTMSASPDRGDLTGKTTRIKVVTADSFCSESGVESVDIWKMDVQGWEMEALKGAGSLFDNNRVHFVFSEVGFKRSDTDMQHFADLNDYLEERGFWLCGFYDFFRYGEQKERLGFCNALYINPDFKGIPLSR
ncbi:MAG TPA: FkbM family methyltransferase [Pyrinomonadaceae bacterium]|jgi:FkbM family methyltransferase